MKILVLRFSSIGDIVLTTPVIRCLKKQTGAEIHLLTKKTFAATVESNPYISQVHTFQKDVPEVLPALRREHFDAVIDLHQNLRSLRVRWALGRPSRGFPKLNMEKWLLVNFNIDRLPRVHIVDRYFRAVEHLGVRYDGQGLDYFIPPEAEVDPGAFEGALEAENYVAVVLGATHATKRLPNDKLLEILQLTDGPLALLGGAAEYDAGAFLQNTLGARAVNLCGKLSLHQSASMLRQARTVLTHDTGLMHIAAALRKPIVSVWGSTVPEFGMYPFYPDGMALHTNMEVANLSCRPCSKIGFSSCPKGHFTCMRGQSAQAIAALIR